MIERFIASIILSDGWRRRLIALVSGALLALAHSPFYLVPLIFVSLPILVWLLDGASEHGSTQVQRFRPAALIGWWFGLGYFVAGLYWLGSAFFVEADRFAALVPLAIFGLPAFLALFWAAAAGVARCFWTDGPARVLILASALTLAEYARATILTGFPWIEIGYIATFHPVSSQTASIFGLHGLTLIVLLVGFIPATLLPKSRVVLISAKHYCVPVCLLLLLHFGYGAYRTLTAELFESNVQVRLVQPVIPQDEKWQPEKADEIFSKYLDLSSAPGAGGEGLDDIDLLVWPESAFPFLLQQRPEALAAIAELLPDGTYLATGAIRRDVVSTDPGYFNSIYIINSDGEIIDSYDKHHLVPFGEYLPFASLLERFGLRKIVPLPGQFQRGLRSEPLLIEGLPPLLPLICYEAIFPHEVNSGEWTPLLLNVTNDAWFGFSPGPYQHAKQARLRAVEQGANLVRAGNTGISMVSDPYGRLRTWIGLEQEGIADAYLPEAIGPTLFSRFGDTPILIAVLAVFALGGLKARHLARDVK